MRPIVWRLTGLCLLIVTAAARADVVHLTTGRALSGTIVKEDEREVVIKTPDGKVTLPRHLVESIERQSKGETLLAMARERARAGDTAGARKLLEEAAGDKDPELAKRARADLEALTAAEERARKLDPKPREPLPLPEGTTGTPLAGTSLQSQLDRARRALEDRDHVLATRLLKALVEGNPADKTLRYLLGRAHEQGGRSREAGEEYAFVLGPKLSGAGRSAAHLGEMARRLLAGDQLQPDSPGVSGDWKRVESRTHFVVYHPFPSMESWLVDETEQALEEVSAKLGVPLHELRFQGRIQVFLFPDQATYEATSGLKLAGGHANRQVAPDGLLYSIAAFPTRSFYRTTLRHEVAHLVIGEVAPGLNAWANEGSATWCEPLETRARLRAFANGRIQSGQAAPLLDLLSDKVPRGDDKEAVLGYYAQANVVFDALVERTGGARKALKVCQRIRREGAEVALRSEGISQRDLQADMARLAANSSSTE